MGNDVLSKYMDYIKHGIEKSEPFMCPKCSANLWRILRRGKGRWCQCTVCGKKKHVSNLTWSRLMYSRRRYGY